MKKYQITIEVDETQLKQIYLEQNKSLTKKDLHSIQEMIEEEFNWLEQSGIKLIESIIEIPTPQPFGLKSKGKSHAFKSN